MKSRFYISSYIASFGLFLVPVATLVLVVLALGNKFGVNEAKPLILLAALGIFQFLIVGTIIYFLVLGKMWDSIQDGKTAISSVNAVGLLFIPIFNFYWLFRAWISFPQEYQNFSNRYSLNLSKPARLAFFIYPALQCINAFLFFLLTFAPILSAGNAEANPSNAAGKLAVAVSIGIVLHIAQAAIFLVVIAQAGKLVNNLNIAVRQRRANIAQKITPKQTFQTQMNFAK